MKISTAKQSRIESAINKLDSEVELNRFNDEIEQAKLDGHNECEVTSSVSESMENLLKELDYQVIKEDSSTLVRW